MIQTKSSHAQLAENSVTDQNVKLNNTKGGAFSSKAPGRRILWGMLIVFALPIIAAKLILSQHWYQSAVTNHGIFLEPPVFYHDFNLTNPAPHQWQIAYLLPEQCEQLCQQQLHLLKQSHIALGKDQPRVMPVVLVPFQTNEISQPVVSDIQQMGFVVYQSSDIQAALMQGELGIAEQDYVLVDPRGQWVMRYPSVQSTQELPSELKGLLADLRKLLKLSRVG